MSFLPRVFLKSKYDPRGIMIAIPATYSQLIEVSKTFITKTTKQSNDKSTNQSANQIVYPCVNGCLLTEDSFPLLRDDDIIAVLTPETSNQSFNPPNGVSNHQSINSAAKPSINQSLNDLHLQSPRSPSKKRAYESIDQSQANKVQHVVNKPATSSDQSINQSINQSQTNQSQNAPSQTSQTQNNQSKNVKTEVRVARDQAILIDDDDTNKLSAAQSINQSTSQTTKLAVQSKPSTQSSTLNKTVPLRICASLGCQNGAKIGPCPECVKRKNPDTQRYFCDQECFSRNWLSHNTEYHL